MKKHISLSIIALLICGILCACGKIQTNEPEVPEVPAEDTTENIADENGRQNEAKQPEDTESASELTAGKLVGEQYTFNGQIGSEEMGYLIDASYAVPEILIDGKVAKEINDEIRMFCLDVIEPTEEELLYPTWYSVGYEAYLNGDVLSILITKKCTMDEAISYTTYNYNIKDDSIVDQAALIKLCGYTEQSFLEQMRKTVAYESDENMQVMFGAYYWDSADVSDSDRQLMYADELRYRQNSIATDRVNMEMPMYLDEAGQLKVIAEIDIAAGEGYYNSILSPRAESKAKDFTISFEDSLFITYKDGVMKIRFEESDWTSHTFRGVNSYLEFGKEYEVEGIYKDYVSGEMMLVYDGEYAIPVFVSDDGMVSALNIYHCAPTGYFCMTEPCMGLKDVKAVTETNAGMIAENVGNTLIGQCDSFAKGMLSIYGLEGFQKIYHGESYDDGIYGYYIGFDENDECTFLYQQFLPGLSYMGECTFLGMNEDGLIFSAGVYADETVSFDNDMHYGAFSLKKYSQWDESLEDIISWAKYKQLGGYIFFEGERELIDLDVVYG